MASTSWCHWEIIEWQEGVADLDRKERSAWNTQMVLCAEVTGVVWVSAVHPVAFLTQLLQTPVGESWDKSPSSLISAGKSLTSHTMLIILTLSSLLSFHGMCKPGPCGWTVPGSCEILNYTANAVPAPMLCVLPLSYAHIDILDTGVYYLTAAFGQFQRRKVILFSVRF